MISLDEIALKHGTDKSTANHKYTPIFEKYLEPWRHKAVRFLEIGIKDGASLRTWDEYFPHPESVLSALDLDPKTLKNVPDTPRWRGTVGKQQSPMVLSEVVKKGGDFHIILDDGSHRGADQWASLEYLWPHITQGGLYLIEDLHCAYQKPMDWNKNVNIVDKIREEFIDKFLRYPEEQDTKASFVHIYKRIIMIGK